MSSKDLSEANISEVKMSSQVVSHSLMSDKVTPGWDYNLDENRFSFMMTSFREVPIEAYTGFMVMFTLSLTSLCRKC